MNVRQKISKALCLLIALAMLVSIAACGEGGDTSDIWQVSSGTDSSSPLDISALTESDDSLEYELSATAESSVVEESSEASIEESSEAEESQEESNDVQDILQYSRSFESVKDAEELLIDGASFCIYKTDLKAPTLYAMVHNDGRRHTDFVYMEYHNVSNKKRVLMKKMYKNVITDRVYFVIDVYDYDANPVFSFRCRNYIVLYDGNIAVFADDGDIADVYSTDGELISSGYERFAIDEFGMNGLRNPSGGLYILRDLNGESYSFPTGIYVSGYKMKDVYIVVVFATQCNLLKSMIVLCDENGNKTLSEYDLVAVLDKYGENIEKLLNDFLVALRADDYDAMRKYATEKLINDYKLYKSTFPDGGADNKTGEAVYSLRCTMPEFHYTIFPRNISGALYVENETKGQFLYGFQVTTDDPHLDKQYLWLATVSDGKGGLLIDSMSFGYVAGGALMHRED